MIRPLLTIDLLAPHQLYFNKKGEKVPSVTAITGMAKPDLSSWANKQGLAGINTDVYVQRTADVGTITHAWIEAHLNGQSLDVSNLDPDALIQSKFGWLRFLEWWSFQPFTFLGTEYRMVSEKMQVGGTLDILVSSPDHTILIDIKTTTSIKREHRIQVAGGYAPMFEEFNGRHIDDVLIVRIGREKVDKIEVEYVTHRREYERAFRALRAAHRALENLPSGRDQAREAS